MTLEILEDFLGWTYVTILAPLALLGGHRGWVLWRWLRTRPCGKSPPTSPAPHNLPPVTVQLPVYDERYVVRRLLHAVARLDYPADRLEIQVLDDSQDDTSRIVERVLAELPTEPRIVHLRRSQRTGYKAGALAAGLRRARGELIAVFDADFVPPPDFLRRLVGEFADPRVGVVQARWEHFRGRRKLLEDLQAILLDGHFVIEQSARFRAGLPFNFNGTAGILRRRCIEDAGGWQGDTLTEDLDLSYRAWLRGWRFVYRPDVACPAELPATADAFVRQQCRWSRGSVQCARKLLSSIWRSKRPVAARVEATFHLLGCLGYPLLLALIFVALPLHALRWWNFTELSTTRRLLESAPLLGATAAVLAYFGAAQGALGRLRFATLARLPCVLSVAAGLAPSVSGAVLSGLGRSGGEFERTPKGGYRSRRRLAAAVELALGTWAAGTVAFAVAAGQPAAALFHALFAAGLLATGGASLLARLRPRVRCASPARNAAASPS